MRVSEHQLFDRNLDIADLALQLPGLASCDAGSDDRPGHIACTSKGCLGRNEHVWNILHSQQLAFNGVKSSTESEHTFSSQRRGRCKRISRGSVSAVRTMNSATPRLRVLVAVNVNIRCREIGKGLDVAHLHLHLFLIVCTDRPVGPSPISTIP
jgi:hypothetical protein